MSLDVMQIVLSQEERWYNKEGWIDNPLKTVMVTFTKQNIMEVTRRSILFGERVHVAQEFNYLGIRLDDKLTWNSHLTNIVNWSQTTLVIMK